MLRPVPSSGDPAQHLVRGDWRLQPRRAARRCPHALAGRRDPAVTVTVAAPGVGIRFHPSVWRSSLTTARAKRQRCRFPRRSLVTTTDAVDNPATLPAFEWVNADRLRREVRQRCRTGCNPITPPDLLHRSLVTTRQHATRHLIGADHSFSNTIKGEQDEKRPNPGRVLGAAPGLPVGSLGRPDGRAVNANPGRASARRWPSAWTP